VGTIAESPRTREYVTVHPHGRGDNDLYGDMLASPGGSPPRAWGQSPYRSRSMTVMRFTPTGVGTMFLGAGNTEISSVHPHGRGDNLRKSSAEDQQDGSPPRAWGQSPQRTDHEGQVRFTPTGVGTIPRSEPGNEICAVHPHGRGDNRAVVLVSRC